jgi:hypothetical protein
VNLSYNWWLRIVICNTVAVVLTFGILVFYLLTGMVDMGGPMVYIVAAVWAWAILSTDLIIASGVLD